MCSLWVELDGGCSLQLGPGLPPETWTHRSYFLCILNILYSFCWHIDSHMQVKTGLEARINLQRLSICHKSWATSAVTLHYAYSWRYIYFLYNQLMQDEGMKQSLSLYINQPIVLTIKLYYPSSESAKEQLESERIMSQNLRVNILKQ